MDDILDMEGSTYLDPHDHGGHLENSTQPFIKLRFHQLGVCMSTWTWDPSLWMSFLDYFNIQSTLVHRILVSWTTLALR
jgi:hypothetical protein